MNTSRDGAAPAQAPIPERGFPLPGLGRFHPYAWTSFVFTLLAVGMLLLALLLVFLTEEPPSIPAAVRLDLLFWSLPTYLVSAPLGIHAVIKYWWPGSTATERAQKPTGRDLKLVAVAFILGVANFVVLIRVFSSAGFWILSRSG